MNAKSTTDYANLCVLRDEGIERWKVLECDACRTPGALAAFESASAADFVFEERERREAAGQHVCTVHLPDDCPCYRRGD
jgi:hypothetical protein